MGSVSSVGGGEGGIGGGSSMGEVLGVFPWAQRALFRRFHIGGCSHCGFDREERLVDLCGRHGLDVEEVLVCIREGHVADLALQISPKEVAGLLEGGEVVRLLDIRCVEEWEVVRLPGAVRMSQESMKVILGEWDRDGLVVVYDHLGRGSLDAAAYFLGQGFRNVRCLAGGIDGWAREVGGVGRYRVDVG